MNKTDGLDHVNVYSRGVTKLGRLLSNFAHTPFVLNNKKFNSVEGWWYWRLTGIEGCCLLYGYEAKKFGRMQEKVNEPITEDELLAVYQAKADQNPEVLSLLRDNTLPFEHYYVYNGVRVDNRYAWTGKLWSKVKT